MFYTHSQRLCLLALLAVRSTNGNLRQLFHKIISQPLSIPPSEAIFFFLPTSLAHTLRCISVPLPHPLDPKKFRSLCGSRRMAATLPERLSCECRFVREFLGFCSDIESGA
ncbi:hypothetical protein JAAARDRAFT_400454 [Jaapia argillacea MUCL 33604]|uniref:Secreted protein n=1 Tax=Jaapia argillacea MUCL 33604 TaxID=933084 RepID=A0A067PI90_9AGAM|nr:hypothetical protein JAAARDRAFT_400454 [Jaapia argillacea MUCL 33604]